MFPYCKGATQTQRPCLIQTSVSIAVVADWMQLGLQALAFHFCIP